MTNYNFSEIEKRWQEFWQKNKVFQTGISSGKPKYYCLVMFPYPSGKIHMGHVRNYCIGDVFARYWRLKGYNVFHPMGWDAFGLPAENAAIKNKIPADRWTRDNIVQMRQQLKALGISYDWEKEISTCQPEYYRWNQWFFLQMYKAGLVYRKKSRVNWCPQCQTVLANEQVSEGKCWRCESPVEEKYLKQWFIRITDFAEELLAGHKELEGFWPEEVLLMQKNWIGKSVGAEVIFPVVDDDNKEITRIVVFTTRPDTLFGATFLALSVAAPVLESLRTRIENWPEVENYIQSHSGRPAEREVREKTGIKLPGLWGVNPVNGKKIPIFVADYILAEYGTGAIMAVPAHDKRDFEFARKYNLEIIPVIKGDNVDNPDEAYEGPGVMINSGQFSGLDSETGAKKITEWLKEKNLGNFMVNYKLRDWLISRQRYWGTPIPIIYCDDCGIVPVPEEDLPVVLPENVQLTGLGVSPLEKIPEFVNVNCPRCGKKARRETDTMDTFVDSSWYFCRYCDNKNEQKPFAPEKVNYWLPVDQYIGGIEHACMHLIYARFWQRFMKKIGLVRDSEPFKCLLTQGMVTLGGVAMSKSRGNIVEPTAMLKKYGADAVRLTILFAAPPEKQLEWSDRTIEGMSRFLNRLFRLAEELANSRDEKKGENNELEYVLNQTIFRVSRDIEKEKQLNTAIAALMEYVNFLQDCLKKKTPVPKTALQTLVILLYPFVPHIAEEINQKFLKDKPLAQQAAWPKYDETKLKKLTIEIPVQIDGKIREHLEIPLGIAENELQKMVKQLPKIESMLEGKNIKKIIYVRDRLVNIVTGE